MSARLLMIGLEATDTDLLERHLRDGRLPTIAALRARGKFRALASNAYATDAALWAAFHYGSDVGEHGRYHDYVRLANGRVGLAVEEEQQREALWDELSRHGLRVAVFDLPKSRTPKPLNGIHLADWLVHGRFFPRPVSYPATLAAEVVGRFGDAPPSRCGRLSANLDDAQSLETLGRLRLSVSMKRAAALHYLQQEPWDCYLVNFKEVHCCSHGFWHLIDPTHPAHDAAKVTRLGDPSTDILDDIDRAVGELIAAAGCDCEVIVFSTSDFQPNGSVHHLVPQLIVQLNKYLWNHGDGSLPPQSNWGVKALLYGENACALRMAADASVDRAATLQAVESLLMKIVDADSGEPIFDACYRPSTQFMGARAHALPDMLLTTKAGSLPRRAVSAQLGTISSEVPRWRPGNHREGGFVIAHGGAVEAAIAGVESLMHLGRVPRNILLAANSSAAAAVQLT